MTGMITVTVTDSQSGPLFMYIVLPVTLAVILVLRLDKQPAQHGSNLALAYLLNASSFLKKASRNCHHLLFLASGNKSLSYEPNYATQHTWYGKQCRS